MSAEVESNPDIEALQAELNHFRATSFKLAGSEIETSLAELIRKTTDGRNQVFAFVGVPGGGKSKLIEKIARHFNVKPCHVRDIAAQNPAIRKLEKEFYKISEIIPGIERDFLNFAFKSSSPVYLLDGFPRSLYQAVELYRYAHQKKCKLTIVEPRLQEGREIFQSYYRQTQRAAFRVKKGLLFGQAEEDERARIVSKIKRALELDLYVIETLRTLGANIINLDASNGPSKMFNQFKEKLGIVSTD